MEPSRLRQILEDIEVGKLADAETREQAKGEERRRIIEQLRAWSDDALSPPPGVFHHHKRWTLRWAATELELQAMIEQ